MNNQTNKVEGNVNSVATEKKDELKLTHLNKDFVYELMAIPTVSSYEYRLITFVVLWARRNNVDFEFDDYGNLYLTKGTINDGEYYPCVTAHLDSVQQKHKLYVQAGQELDVKTRTVLNKHEIFVDGMGIGGDDKAGVLIALSMFSHVDKLKACFFLEEEIGCKGSDHLNVDWFKNVGYVIGYDSPDLNRAAWACSGTKLFSADFFKNHIKDICAKHGLTDFRSEPFTDVKKIREKTNVMCMNFGSGYYEAHSPREYCVIEDMDTACRMGHEIIEHLGLKRYELENKAAEWTKDKYGTFRKSYDEDEEYFSSTFAPKYQYSGYTSNTNNTTSTTTQTSKTNDAKGKETLNTEAQAEIIKYMSETYDEYIDKVKNDIKAICEKKNIDFSEFEQVFSKEIKF